MNTYLIGDTHFSHANVIQFEPIHRPFKSIEEHDRHLVEAWNSVVRWGDRVLHVGDVALSRGWKQAEVCIKQLQGEKHLIVGNHDVKLLPFLAPYFTIHPMMVHDRKLLTHIPIHPNSLVRWGANIHGHLHSRVVVHERPMYLANEEGTPDSRYWNVSVEHLPNLAPINYDLLVALHKGGG